MSYSKQYLDALNPINANYQRGYVIKASEYNSTFNLLSTQGNTLNANIRAIHELLVGDSSGDVAIPRGLATLLEALQVISDESAQDQLDIQAINDILIPATDLIQGLMQPEEFNKIYQNEVDLGTHKTSNDHDGRYSTKTELMTAGQAILHWGNLIGIPDMADPSWKPTVATKANLPLTGNTLADQRKVLDDGDGKMAIYICIATSGDVDTQWDKIADVDWESGETTRIANEDVREANEAQRITSENTRLSSESSRAFAEGARDEAEIARNDAEALRVLAENARATAETQREADVAQHITDVQTSAYHPGNPQPLPTPEEIGAEPAHLHPYLPLAGGVLGGHVTPSGLYDLGSSGAPFQKIYASEVYQNNLQVYSPTNKQPVLEKHTASMPAWVTSATWGFWGDITIPGLDFQDGDKCDVYDTPANDAEAALVASADIYYSYNIGTDTVRLCARNNVDLTSISCAIEIIKGGG